ncbi:MAG: hypothetical protein JKY70_04245 [Mucilaginibacter sp.]|nr:hypothetical protein [Mucilaginibacter sp.]
MKKIAFYLALSIFSISCKKDSPPVIPPASNVDPVPKPGTVGGGITVTIDQTQPSATIPANFLGLSYETGVLSREPDFLSAHNTVLIQLMKNLGNGVLRVGGNSSDTISWTGKARTVTTSRDSLTTTDIDQFSLFSKALGWPVLFGLNMVHYSPAIAANEASYVANSLQDRLLAIQCGNEPDLYHLNGNRLPNYTYQDYAAQWNSYYLAIKTGLPTATFAGPDIGSNLNYIKSFLSDYKDKVPFFDCHYYNTGPASSPAITDQTILASDINLDGFLKELHSLSTAYHLPYRISECNSVYDGGKAGVSDVFASALWGLDFMWLVAENNGLGVNFHGGNDKVYGPLKIENHQVTAKPLYYAMLAFKYGAAGNRIIPAIPSNKNYNFTSYACVNGEKTFVTLINKDTTDLAVTIQMNRPASSMQVYRLKAPAVNASANITFAGKSVNNDGTFQEGAPESYPVAKNATVIDLPARSAAVVEIL